VNDEDNGDGITVYGNSSGGGGGLQTIVGAACLDTYAFKFVFVEPIEPSQPSNNTTKTKNQVQEFLDFNGGAGVQHIALRTSDIIQSVSQLKENGVEFITVPYTYYNNLYKDEDWLATSSLPFLQKETLQELGILLDISHRNTDPNTIEQQYTQNDQPHATEQERDDCDKEKDAENLPKLIMQTFSAPIFDRPTFFFEIICRKGSTGFGSRTIQALFKAVERLQQQRGTL